MESLHLSLATCQDQRSLVRQDCKQDVPFQKRKLSQLSVIAEQILDFNSRVTIKAIIVFLENSSRVKFFYTIGPT